jgi:hypothetical protein
MNVMRCGLKIILVDLGIGHVISGYSSKTEINFISLARIKFRIGIIQTISYPCTELETWYRRPTPAHDYRADRRCQIFGIGCEDSERTKSESDPADLILSYQTI